MACFSKQSICVLFIYLICWTNLCVYVCLFLSAKMNYTGRISTAKIIDSVSSLCPAEVCSLHTTELNRSSMDLPECCGDCSCLDDCDSADSRCCFTNETERDNEECLIPSTGVPDPLYLNMYTRYIMRSSCPQSSNKFMDDADPTLNNLCHNISVAPWGSLYPVYSHQTGTIYKNEECAMCNKDYIVTAWTPVLSCDLDYRKGDFYRQLDIDNFVEFYLGGDIYDICLVNFIPPVSADLLKKKLCYKHTIDTCAGDNFKIPDNLRLTMEEVVLACESNFLSPFAFGFLYKNIFCFICNGKNIHTSTMSSTCEQFFQPGISQGRFSTFTSFINLDLMQTLPHVSNRMQACNYNKSVCKEVLCPSARVRLEQGNCILPTALWQFKTYQVLLKLTPSASMGGIKKLTIRKYKEISPWPKAWIIDNIGLYQNQNTSTVDHVYIKMEIQKTFQNPVRLLNIVAKYSSRPWCYNNTNNNNKGKKMCLLSDFLSYKTVLGETISVESIQRVFFPEYLKYPDQRSNATEIYWLPVLESIKRKQVQLTIGKMFFCDQIELDDTEYILLHMTRVVYYIQKKQYLFDGEFVLIMTDAGTNIRVRICLEDSNLKLQAVENVANIHKIAFEAEGLILVLIFMLVKIF